jgi:hypothetical protein
MKNDKPDRADQPPAGGSVPSRILGSLRDALAAASRDATGEFTVEERTELLPRDHVDKPAVETQSPAAPQAQAQTPVTQSAADAVREAKSPPARGHYEAEPTTRVVRGKSPDAVIAPAIDDTGKTQVVRGRPKVGRSNFAQDPVVGWLVVVGGPGLGSFRSIYEGNNAIGRSPTQRIPIDFGDNTISSEEQAYIRYDSMDRSFLFVPNLAKTNVVAVNNSKPTGAVKLELMDVISMGRTQLAFVPFCGEEFDWSELTGLKE